MSTYGHQSYLYHNSAFTKQQIKIDDEEMASEVSRMLHFDSKPCTQKTCSGSERAEHEDEMEAGGATNWTETMASNDINGLTKAERYTEEAVGVAGRHLKRKRHDCDETLQGERPTRDRYRSESSVQRLNKHRQGARSRSPLRKATQAYKIEEQNAHCDKPPCQNCKHHANSHSRSKCPRLTPQARHFIIFKLAVEAPGSYQAEWRRTFKKHIQPYLVAPCMGCQEKGDPSKALSHALTHCRQNLAIHPTPTPSAHCSSLTPRVKGMVDRIRLETTYNIATEDYKRERQRQTRFDTSMELAEEAASDRLHDVNSWAPQVLGHVLETEMGIRPGSWLEVCLAVKSELQIRLMNDVVYGDPRGGTPVSYHLLQALQPGIEKLRTSD